ncbi:MAG: hypothetical protein CMM87_04045 [Rickettsiales bacterium]|nr:hypothetical protein [Rickettsiales bacterium]|tara:strand:+ start:43762 stop:44874 length:1113 start_codon:yes stop_codon:yes gene_type:complete
MKKLFLLILVAWTVSQGRVDMLSEPEVAAIHYGYSKSSLTNDLPLQEDEKSSFTKNNDLSLKDVDAEIIGLSISKVKQYGKYAKMAYIQPKEDGSHEEEMRKYLQPGDKVYYFATNIENSGMIIEHEDGDITIVYKGSTSLNNWVSDFWANFAYDANTGFRVHNGIMKGFYRTKDQVFNILDDIAKARQKSTEELLEKVTITGHSMGGGLTQLLQGYILANYDVETRAVSFAAPRVYDIATAEALDKRLASKHLNISQTGDPVPLVALQGLGFRHYGTHLSLPHMWDAPHLMTNYLLALEMLEQEQEYQGFWRYYHFKEGTGELWNPYYYRAKYVDPYAHTSLKWLKDGTLYGFSNGYDFFADYWTPKQP